MIGPVVLLCTYVYLTQSVVVEASGHVTIYYVAGPACSPPIVKKEKKP